MVEELLGRRIRRLRRERDLSQARVAEMAAVSPAYLNRLEGGKAIRPGVDILRRIARVLGVSVDVLVGDVAVPPAVSRTPFDPADAEEEQQIVHRFAELARRRWNADAIMLLRTRAGEAPEGIYGLDTIRLNTLRKPAVLA